MSDAELRARRAALEGRLRLSRAEYELQREALAKEFGIRVTGLDAIFNTIPTASKADAPPQAESWPEPVDGNELLVALCHTFERYLIVSVHAILALALWVIHSHAHAAANQSPILLIWGPMADCGKSRALDVVSRLVANVLRCAGLTLAYVLRKAPGHTVCWDELDKELKKKGQTIDGWFTNGWQRGRIFGRCEGDTNTPTDYDPWLPKAVAMIRLPYDEQVRSRCLPIEMRRKLEGEEVEEYFETEEYPELKDLRAKVARWASDHLDQLRKARPERPTGLRGTRPFDNWRPLFAIADQIGGEWSEQARVAALALQPRSDQDRSVELLGDLRDLFNSEDRSTRTPPQFWTSAEIVKHLVELEDREYDTVNRGRAITQKWLAMQLSPFKIEPDQPWEKDSAEKLTKTKRGYHVAQFADTFARYLPLPSKPSDPSDPSDPAANGSGSDGSLGSDGLGGQGGVDDDPTAELF